MIDMFRKKPVLQYESAIDVYPNIVTPAKNHIPDWYKEIPRWKNNEIFDMNTGSFNTTIKQCMPFLDSLTIGYMIVLPNDLYVKNNNGKPYITWKGGDFGPNARSELSTLNLVPTSHHPTEFTWQSGVSITIPSNYNAIFTHPLNRHDLPFTTVSGVIDGGFVMYPRGNIPFFIKEGFEGIINQGTPIIQIIPFRKENWHSKIKNGLVKLGYDEEKKGKSLINGFYKKTYWTRKKYD